MISFFSCEKDEKNDKIYDILKDETGFNEFNAVDGLENKMKFYTIKRFESAEEELAVEKPDQKGLLIPFKQINMEYQNMLDFVAGTTDAELEAMEVTVLREQDGIALKDVIICAPIPEPKQDIICLGINYHAHQVEAEGFSKEAFYRENFPIYFSKRVNRAVADNEGIPSHSDIVDSLDYESELAVILKKDAKDVSAKDAFDYVFGYTVINDVSARNVQTRHKQWYFGKSMDGFTPMGPCIVSKNDFAIPPVLHVKSYVNGELRQNSTTDLLIFDIAYVIEDLSRGMTLKAGTIISMGTPAGVGMGFKPPKFLQTGDEVICEIEEIGKITNRVI